jgi:hypothetical protein
MSDLVTLLLDKSGSMSAVRDATIEAVNAYLDTLKEQSGTLFSLVQFDSNGLEKTCVRTPIEQSPRLDKSNYIPAASTPLVDAAVKTIHAVDASLSQFEKRPKVVFAIQTDGQENASTEYTMADLNKLIKDKTVEGWQFVFMGCGIDAYDQAAQMGIATADTMSYNATAESTKSAFASAAMNTRSYLNGASATASFSAAQRNAAGDAYWDKRKTSGGPSIPSAGPQSTTKAKSKPRIVDDVTL